MNGSARTGKRGEDTALAYLVGLGFSLVCRNHRSAYGEIDLVMTDGGTLVFVEVKTRTKKTHASALECITPSQKARIMRAAVDYHAKRAPEQFMRIDVVALDFDGTGYALTHVKSAITG